MTSFSTACVLTGVVSAMLGIFVVAKNPRNSVNVYWCLASLSVALWSGGLGLMTSAAEYSSAVFWLRIHYIGAILIPVLYLHFVIKLLGSSASFMLRLSYGIAAAFLVLSFSGNLVDVVPKQPFNFYTRGLYLRGALCALSFSQRIQERIEQKEESGQIFINRYRNCFSGR
jgi:hypothetical protein